MRTLFAAAVLTLGLAGQGHAATLFSDDFSPQQSGWSAASPSAGFFGELGYGALETVTLTYMSSGVDPAANLNFDLLAFRTIDGVNCCTDRFSLIVNGNTLFSGALSSGGGGATDITINAGTITGGPGTFNLDIPFALEAGANVFSFSYGGLQGVGDEAWGLDNVVINGTPAAVPEPGTWALMAAGLAGIGLIARRRRA